MAQDKSDLQAKTSSAPKQTKHSTGARVAVALAFTTVGAKLGLIGTAADAADVLHEEATFGKKFKALFNGTAFGRLQDRVMEGLLNDLEKNPHMTTGEQLKASLRGTGKAFK